MGNVEPPLEAIDTSRTIGVIGFDISHLWFEWIHVELRRVLVKLDPTIVIADATVAGHSAATHAGTEATRLEVVRPGRLGRMPMSVDGRHIEVPWDYDLVSPYSLADHTDVIGQEISTESWQAARSRIIDTSSTVVIVTSRMQMRGALKARAVRHHCDVISIDPSRQQTLMRRSDE